MPVTPAVFTIPDTTFGEVPNHTVYVKARWADEWTAVDGLFCEQVSFAVAPTISTAQLRYEYGKGIRAKDETLTAQWYTRLSGMQRAYVKVKIDGMALNEGDPISFEWIGVSEELAEFVGGTLRVYSDPETYMDRTYGRQTFRCMGMEYLLDKHEIRHSFWRKDDDEDNPKKVEKALPFNTVDAAGQIIGNRAENRKVEEGVFHPYLFTSKLREADKIWSTSDIAGYLLKMQTPRRGDPLAADIPFAVLDTAELLPTWDKPVIETEGRTTWSVLCELMHRGKMLGLWFEIQAGTPEGAPDRVVMRPYTMVSSDLTVDGSNVIKANPRQVRVVLENDHTSDVNFGSESYQMVDQVIVIGAKRTSTCTLAYRTGEAKSIKEGWSSELQTEYDAAAKDRDGYADLSKAEKQSANALARSQEKLQTVYSRIVLDDSWDYKTNASHKDDDPAKPVFPSDSDSTQVEPQYGRTVTILPTTRLRDGYDWRYIDTNGGPMLPEVTPGPHNLLPAMIFFNLPDEPEDLTSDPAKPGKWVEGRQINKLAKIEAEDADKNFYRWSATLKVPIQDRSFWINVQGDQHILVGPRFSPPSETEDKPAGEWDWRKAYFTVTFEDCRKTEVRWPADDSLSSDKDNWRRLVVPAGDKYRCDHVLTNTVVAVNPVTAELHRVSLGGYLVDDRPKLLAIAKRAYAYYSQPRRSLSWKSNVLATQLKLGDYITEIGDVNRMTVGAVITEISISIPTNGSVISIDYRSAYMELDKLREVIL